MNQFKPNIYLIWLVILNILLKHSICEDCKREEIRSSVWVETEKSKPLQQKVYQWASDPQYSIPLPISCSKKKSAIPASSLPDTQSSKSKSQNSDAETDPQLTHLLRSKSEDFTQSHAQDKCYIKVPKYVFHASNIPPSRFGTKIDWDIVKDNGERNRFGSGFYTSIHYNTMTDYATWRRDTNSYSGYIYGFKILNPIQCFGQNFDQTTFILGPKTSRSVIFANEVTVANVMENSPVMIVKANLTMDSTEGWYKFGINTKCNLCMQTIDQLIYRDS